MCGAWEEGRSGSLLMECVVHGCDVLNKRGFARPYLLSDHTLVVMHLACACLYNTEVFLKCMLVIVQLTRMAGDWIPRLERMVVSRGLCAFEKSVLITLIGFVIQPNKVRRHDVCWV